MSAKPARSVPPRTDRSELEPPRPSPIPIARSVLAALQVHARRWRLVRWAVALSAIGVLTMSVSGARSNADLARRQWSETRIVWVALDNLNSGQNIEPGDVAQRELPIGALPVDPAENPVGLRLRDYVVPGEVIRSGRLAPIGSGEIASRLPPGTRGVTVAVDSGSVLTVADFADLISLSTGTTVAHTVRVISIGDGWATFAVSDRQVSRVVNELTLGGVIAVLLP